MASRRTRRLASALALCALLWLAGCGTTDAVRSGLPTVPQARAGDGPAMSAALLPFTPSEVRFVQQPRGVVTLRTAPAGDGGALYIEGKGAEGRRIDVTRTTTGYVFGAGPGQGVELLRFAATPGTRWTSGATEVVFDGWERVETPAAVHDAARVRTVSGTSGLEVREAWWFAPDVGLVRYVQDNAGLFAMEMVRAE